MFSVDCRRPPKLYRYSLRHWLERSLTLGEFRLRPATEEVKPSPRILPFQSAAAQTAPGAACLVLSLAQAWDQALFNEFSGADCCLVIHDTEEFGERIHRAAEKVLPTWAGIDAGISYGVPSPLGKTFSKIKRYAVEKEWQFAWRPTQPTDALSPIIIRIGSIEDIAELRGKGA
ncbi:MAG: hypothetical protein JWQ21_74 [Herminiimonas sp.]|nr:hypothetical protein [Herminiimonas sp.]